MWHRHVGKSRSGDGGGIRRLLPGKQTNNIFVKSSIKIVEI